jgi:hypothetical protein
MGPNMSVQQFVERLNELNRNLLYFTEECPTPLVRDEFWTKPSLLSGMKLY